MKNSSPDESESEYSRSESSIVSSESTSQNSYSDDASELSGETDLGHESDSIENNGFETLEEKLIEASGVILKEFDRDQKDAKSIYVGCPNGLTYWRYGCTDIKDQTTEIDINRKVNRDIHQFNQNDIAVKDSFSSSSASSSDQYDLTQFEEYQRTQKKDQKYFTAPTTFASDSFISLTRTDIELKSRIRDETNFIINNERNIEKMYSIRNKYS